MMPKHLHDFIAETEKAYFRTQGDTGANLNALFIWNRVREYAGLPPLELKDLPALCEVHGCYHALREDYGCAAATPAKTKLDDHV